MPRRARTLFIIMIASLSSGCALNVPRMQRIGEKPELQWVREKDLINHVKCEIGQAVRIAIASDLNNQSTIPPANRTTWLYDWGAKVNLKIIIDDKATVAPALSITTPLENAVKVFRNNGNVTVARNRSLGFGASFTSDATRTETIGFFYTFKDLMNNGTKPMPPGAQTGKFCGKIDGFSIDDDLDIENFVQSKVFISQQEDVLERKLGKSPYDVFTYEVSFVVTSAANATPGWKLARVAIMPTGTFFNGQRVRTNDLTITMGPLDENNKTQPSRSVLDANLAAQIGQAVATAIQSKQQ